MYLPAKPAEAEGAQRAAVQRRPSHCHTCKDPRSIHQLSVAANLNLLPDLAVRVQDTFQNQILSNVMKYRPTFCGDSCSAVHAAKRNQHGTVSGVALLKRNPNYTILPRAQLFIRLRTFGWFDCYCWHCEVVFEPTGPKHDRNILLITVLRSSACRWLF